MKEEENKPTGNANDKSGADSADDQAEVYAVHRTNSGWRLRRRDLAGVAAAAATTLAVKRRAGAQAPQMWYADNEPVKALAITPDGETLISRGRREALKFWKLPEGAHRRTVAINEAETTDDTLLIAAGSDGRTAYVALATDYRIRVFDVPSGEPLHSIELSRHTDALALSADAQILIRATSRDVEVWALPDGSRRQSISAPDSVAVAISSDGEFVAAGDRHGYINIWSIPEGVNIGQHCCPAIVFAATVK